MDLKEYRGSDRELMRTTDLMRLVPINGHTALDVGARDGHFSRLLADRYSEVVALDLTKPNIDHLRIRCAAGNLLNLEFADKSFDFVLCAEVLEHIPSADLPQACKELARVTRGYLLIGVPFKQDLRLNQTSCHQCGQINPPWGHINRFDAIRLRELFTGLDEVECSLVGETKDVTNSLSAALMTFAGNPFGTYDQDEPCINCGSKLLPPVTRNIAQRLATRVAHWMTNIQQHITPPHANWIHLLFRCN